MGDTLPTMFGGMAPIQWIARYSLKKSDPSKPWLKEAMPVRIARSALAPGVPQSDLYVTGRPCYIRGWPPDTVGNLINGTTITAMKREDTMNSSSLTSSSSVRM